VGIICSKNITLEASNIPRLSIFSNNRMKVRVAMNKHQLLCSKSNQKDRR
jgi:hypothetical protein